MDGILASWIASAAAEAFALADDSDRFDLEQLDLQRYVARFYCRGLVGAPSGEIGVCDEFHVGIAIADAHLRQVDSMRVLTWLAPWDMWHPNRRGPVCCIGKVHPGTSLVDIIHRVYMVITYQEVMPDENDALNHAACSWARKHLERFPVDDRPLKRRADERGARDIAAQLSG